MTDNPIRRFAAHHRVRLRQGQEETMVIPGRDGQIWEYSDTDLCVGFIGRPSVRRWNAFRRLGIAAGMKLHQDGDDEGSLRFDPENPTQADVALRIARVRRRRQVSEVERLKLAAKGFQEGSTPRKTGVSGRQIAPNVPDGPRGLPAAVAP